MKKINIEKWIDIWCNDNAHKIGIVPFLKLKKDDANFIMSKMQDISEHYIEQQEYLYYQAFLDCIELLEKFPNMLTDTQLKEKIVDLRG